MWCLPVCTYLSCVSLNIKLAIRCLCWMINWCLMLNVKSACFMRPPTWMNDSSINGLNGITALFWGIALLYFNWLHSSGYDSNLATLQKISLAIWISSGDNLLKSTLLFDFLLLLIQFCLIFVSNTTQQTNLFHDE